MIDAISRSAALESAELISWYHVNQNGKMVSGASSCDEAYVKFSDVITVLDDAKALDVAPVVHARWKIECDLHVDYYGETDEEFFIECPLCGRREYNINQFKAMDGNYEETTKEYPYCHCGARMDAKES